MNLTVTGALGEQQADKLQAGETMQTINPACLNSLSQHKVNSKCTGPTEGILQETSNH